MTKKIDYGTVTKEVICNYNDWLSYSSLTESDLLKFRFLRPVNILKEYVNGLLCVSLVIGKIVVGECFVSPTLDKNDSFMIDVSFILLYIAQRLDEANRAAPPLLFCENENEYFYSMVRKFLKSNSF